MNSIGLNPENGETRCVTAAQASRDADLEENMDTLQQSPAKFALLKASISTARKDGLYC